MSHVACCMLPPCRMLYAACCWCAALCVAVVACTFKSPRSCGLIALSLAARATHMRNLAATCCCCVACVVVSCLLSFAGTSVDFCCCWCVDMGGMLVGLNGLLLDVATQISEVMLTLAGRDVKSAAKSIKRLISSDLAPLRAALYIIHCTWGFCTFSAIRCCKLQAALRCRLHHFPKQPRPQVSM